MLTDPAMFSQIDTHTSSMIDAMASAEGRAPRASATEADWAAFVGSLPGYTEALRYVPLVSAADAADPDYCPAIIWFIDAVSQADGDTGERIKASFARDIAIT